MTYLTALVIVFALTGAPIANAVCLVSCQWQHMTGACEESMAQPAISSGSGLCPTLVADLPLVREDGRIVFDASAAPVAQPAAMPLGPVRQACVRTESQAIDGRRMQPVVLRL